MSDQNNNTYKSAFFIVPSYITELPGITWAFIKVYETIFQFWNHKKPCFLSDSSLLDRAKVGQSQLYEAFAYFERHGELVRRKNNGKRYLVQPERGIEIDCKENIPTSGRPEPDFRQSGSATSGRAEHNKKNLNKEKKLKDIPDSTNTGTPKIKNYEADERFMRFYNAYPKKVDPRDAWKAFKSVVGDDDAILDHILNDLEIRKSKHSQWKDKQYIKYPAVYLRKGEYLGEIFNINEENQKKDAAKKIVDEKNISRREELSRNALAREKEELEQIQKDGRAFRLVKNQMSLQGKTLEGLKNLRKSVGLE